MVRVVVTVQDSSRGLFLLSPWEGRDRGGPVVLHRSALHQIVDPSALRAAAQGRAVEAQVDPAWFSSLSRWTRVRP